MLYCHLCQSILSIHNTPLQCYEDVYQWFKGFSLDLMERDAIPLDNIEWKLDQFDQSCVI
jgi:hypothetical protein